MVRNRDFLKDKTKAELQRKTAKGRNAKRSATLVQTRLAASRRNDLQPALRYVTRPIADLKCATRRVRETSDEQLARVIHSLQAFSQVTPVLIDEEDHIVDGHIVWQALRELGSATIQCLVVTHLTEEERRAYAVAANRIAETGAWSLDELRIELEELGELNFDLEATGFSLPEIDIILEDSGEESSKSDSDDDDDDGDAPVVSRLGDRFMLGRHRLLCADALLAASYEALMDGDRAAAVISDPPYNCPIDGNVSGLGKQKHEDFVQGVGEMTDEQFTAFLATYLERCRRQCEDGAVIFAFMDWRQIDLLLQAGRTVGLKRVHIAVWNKGTGGMGSLYRSAHEFVAVFCNGGAVATNNVALGRHGRDRTSVWTYPGATQRGSSAAKALTDHPTPKPVELLADAMRDVTKRGDIVLDPFMGSGATIMAAEQCGRIAYGLELDPKYVDRILRRWERATGSEAVHVGTGLTFAELCRQRAAEPDPTSGNDMDAGALLEKRSWVRNEECEL